MRKPASLLMMCLLGLMSCSGAGTSGGKLNFTLTTDPAVLTLEQGNAAAVNIYVQRTGGDFPVQVSVADLPSGVTADPITLAAGVTQSTLTFSASPTAATGKTLATIKGTAEGARNEIDFELTVQGSTPVNADLKAFPTAEGFGAKATGGRGGKVLYVTNLNASGPGSLQSALDEPGKRTIVFKVSGLINTVAYLRHGDVTIGGQTSPGGITLRGLRIENDESICEQDGCPLPSFTPSNFVVQFLRLRPAGFTDDGLRFHRAKNGIVDHLSIGNAEDESVQVSFTSDVTIQNSIIAETVGGHAEYGGMLLNYSDPTRDFPLTRLSIHHNNFNRIMGRLPEMSRENNSARGSTMEIEVSNNLYTDPYAAMWLSNTSLTQPDGNGYATDPVYTHANFVGNLMVYPDRAGLKFGMLSLDAAYSPDEGYLPEDTKTRIFMQDNHINLFSAVQDYQLIYCCNDFDQAVKDMAMPYAATKPTWSQEARHPFPSITYTPSSQLADHIFKNVGVFPRDPMDTRLLGAVKTGIIDSTPQRQNPANDALLLPAVLPPAPQDTDNDGMPDAWETANGLNPKAPDNNGTTLSKAKLGMEGYTNLEVYLHELMQDRLAGK
ncbi:hypothetical protein [Deinococcus misasensis]|uniref:hypothetical protein n=1 Tax=Deinococcus misasensis TaxID=392413 RepID=UPI00054ED9FC|nr:hypothetical protein [Deinococcus misasensis]